MNIILLHDNDFITPSTVRLEDRRHQHIRTIHKAEVGDRLKVGKINGPIGKAEVITIDDKQTELHIETLEQEPPAPLPLTLILALPRPKMLKRILQTATTMGVKDLWLINSYRVDKSYWSTPWLSDSALQEQLLLGLEQAGDTRLPEVHLRKRFKPFVEDELPTLAKEKRALVAHPYQAAPCPAANWQETLLAIGPEGGFIPYEVEKLVDAGLTSTHLGRRILRVETAVPALLSRLFPLPFD